MALVNCYIYSLIFLFCHLGKSRSDYLDLLNNTFVVTKDGYITHKGIHQNEKDLEYNISDDLEDDSGNYTNYTTFEEYLQFIHPKAWTWVLIVLHSLVFVIGLVGNCLVCVAVYRNHSMRTVTNYFIVNLALADFMVILFCLPPSVIWDVTSTWWFGTPMCKIVLYMQSVSVTVSVLTLTFISVDRWYAICYPLKFKSTTGRAKTAIGVIWIIAMACELPEPLYLTAVPYHKTYLYLSQCMPTWSTETDLMFVLVKMIFFYIIPLLFMSIAYLQIIRVLWKSGKAPHQAVGAMLSILSGEASVWSSAVIPKLKSNNTEENPLGRPITTLELSMFAGLPSLSMLLGSLLHGYLSGIIGRKRTLQLSGIGILLSSLSMAYSTNIILMTIIRCFWFCFYIGSMTVFPVYLTEICEDHNRGKYGCLSSAFIPVGNLISYSLGSMFNFKNFTLIGTAPLIIFLYFFIFAPESPVYSLSKNKKEECMTTLKKLRSDKNKDEIQEDFVKLETMLKANDKNSNILSLFKTKERRYGLMLACSSTSLIQFSGIGIILPFMEPIFLAAGTKFDSSRLPILVAAIKVASYLFTSLIIEKAGKRFMLQISAVGIGIPLFILGLFFHLKSIDSPLILQLQWLPLVCIISYIILFSLGIGPVPMAMNGEFFTSDLRAAGMSVATTCLGILSFCSSSSFPIIVERFGMQWCMWLYTVFCVLGAVFIFVFIPETKGKSLMEIQEYIKSRCKN